MTPTDLKSRISAAVQAFASKPSSQQAQTLRHAALAFFKELGYASDRSLPPCSVAQFCTQFDAKGELNHQTALKADWQSADLLFQLTDEELSTTTSLFKDTTVVQSRAASYVFFAIQLQAKDYTRSQLAAITRRLNRVFPMPVMVLYQFGEPEQPCLSIAVINRRAHKKDADKDVLGKVTLIHHIAIAAPHRGHVDIIASFAASELAKTQRIDSFDALHAAWEAVFNVELLNKRFYEELANWYFWARGQVRFPPDLEPDEATRNATSVIRLLTRLIFVWFLKEKNLIPNSLFDPAHLATVLKDWQPAGAVGWASAHQSAQNKAGGGQENPLPTLQNAQTGANDTGIYYRAILQNLFFATLNQEMGSDGKPSPRQFVTNDGHLSNRTHHGIKTLYRYDECFHSQAQALALFEGIPFLNGGLFACLDIEDAANKVQYADGFTRSKTKQAQVPDALFFAQAHVVDLSADYGDKKKALAPVRGLIHILNGYKFTILESTPVEQEIALDPELLGNVFENLLASYNPETGQSARKQTGSFYTPRPIVDYMVDEALKAYLAQALCAALPTVSPADAQVGLDVLFAYTDKTHAFTPQETAALIAAIDTCNILDPACGSGAYPMGILHKLVFILAKLDPANAQWKQRQLDGVLAIEDSTVRDDTLARIESDFADNNLDFGRKLYLIEKCIYGVDIQPIAIQIAKLRFFISLVCDQRIYPQRPNLGVRPLPNLEIKFVAANTLIALALDDVRGFYESPAVLKLEKDLADVRHLYFSAKRREDKKRLKVKDAALVEQIIAELQTSGFAGDDVIRRARWSPYDAHGVADFFDPTTMFGPALKAGFDVVIGNPPYVQIQKFPAAQKQLWQAQGYATYGAMADIYCLFYERGAQLLRDGGQLCYITSNKWMRAGYGELLRSYFANQVTVQSVVDFSGISIFSAAVVDTNITHFTKTAADEAHQPSAVMVGSQYRNFASLGDYVKEHATLLTTPKDGKDGWVVMSSQRAAVKAAVVTQGIKLEKWHLRINYGIKTGYNEAFYINDAQRAALIAADPHSAELIVPLLRGRSIDRFCTDWARLEGEDSRWMINAHNGIKEQNLAAIEIKRDYPAVWKFFLEHQAKLAKRADQGDHWSNLRSCAYLRDFEQPKIIYAEMTKWLPFYYDHDDHFYTNDTTYIATSEVENLPALTAQLNSTLFRACFIDNFPSLGETGRRVKKLFFDQIPLVKPSAMQADVLAGLVLRVQAAKRRASPSTSTGRTDVGVAHETAFVEQWIDACVMQLYFGDEMARIGCDFFTPAAQLLATCPDVASLYAIAADSKHPVRNGLIRLPIDSPDIFAVILTEGAV